MSLKKHVNFVGDAPSPSHSHKPRPRNTGVTRLRMNIGLGEGACARRGGINKIEGGEGVECCVFLSLKNHIDPNPNPNPNPNPDLVNHSKHGEAGVSNDHYCSGGCLHLAGSRGDRSSIAAQEDAKNVASPGRTSGSTGPYTPRPTHVRPLSLPKRGQRRRRTVVRLQR